MKPILFNTEMVKAILDGRKTVTRRVAFKADELREFPCALYPDGWWFRGRVYASRENAMNAAEGIMRLCKYRPGDILWVRETWAKDIDGEFVYRTDYGTTEDDSFPPPMFKWRPSIHMPREAARIFLRVTDVRVERLQDITEDDVCAEGAEPLIQCPYEHPTYGPDGVLGDMCWNTDCCGGCKYVGKTYGELFGELVWDRTIPRHPNKFKRYPFYWSDNPWVWVIEFEVCEKTEA